MRGDRLIGQIYLLLDGSRSQSDVVQALTDAGIETNPMGVSRRITKMHTDHGLIELVRLGVGGARIFRKHTKTETVLNLSKNIGDWLKAEGATVPVTVDPEEEAERMIGVSKGELLRRLGQEFESQGWEYTLTLGSRHLGRDRAPRRRAPRGSGQPSAERLAGAQWRDARDIRRRDRARRWRRGAPNRRTGWSAPRSY